MADVAHFVDAKKQIGSMSSMRCANDLSTEFEDGLRYIFRLSKGTKNHMSLKRQRILRAKEFRTFI